jgi:hypothetical protein
MTTIKVSKLDAAKRQLDTAIRLWFNDDDPVAIHALASAAYEIIQNINEKKGDKSLTLIELTRSVIKVEHVEEAMQLIKKPMNFFKHANRDPHAILEFNPKVTESFFAIAIQGLKELGEQRSDVQTAFAIWSLFHKPDHFSKGQEFINHFGRPQIEEMKILKKSDFLDGVLQALAQQRIRGR